MIDSPIVIFSDITVEQIVSYWLDINIDFVNSYLGMILNKIGFSKDDNVFVYGYTKDSYLLFKVNGVEEHRILMSSKNIDNDKYNPVVYYEDENILDGYECVIDKYNRFDIDFIRIKYNDEDVDRLIKYNEQYEDISVSKGDYIIEFRISKLGNGLYNKRKIMSYLNDLVLPVSILDIYKEICEISSLDDISCYSLIDLRLVNKENEVEEMIVLSDGRLVSLLVNSNDKMISCDNKGFWSCETDNALVDFSITKSNGIVDFSSKVRPKGNIDDYSLEFANHDLNVAKKEITSVKRLVKRMFDK